MTRAHVYGVVVVSPAWFARGTAERSTECLQACLRSTSGTNLKLGVITGYRQQLDSERGYGGVDVARTDRTESGQQQRVHGRGTLALGRDLVDELHQCASTR